MNAGNPPSNAILKMGVRPPIQRWHSHSELRKNNPIPSPKTRMPISPSVRPNTAHPRTSSGQSSGNESNCRLCQTSRSEGMCARLKVLVSSRHSGPACIAVSTSSMAEKAVPISAAEVSIPSFGIRFEDIALEIGRPNCRSSMSSTRALHLRDRPEPVFSQRINANPPEGFRPAHLTLIDLKIRSTRGYVHVNLPRAGEEKTETCDHRIGAEPGHHSRAWCI